MTTTSKTFAPNHERNEQGWVIFPRDIERRRKLFPNKQLPGSVHDVFEHPAKMNLFLVDALTEYISEPGDWILEPFGGTGSTALAATRQRHVCLLEIEPSFGEIIQESASILVPGGAALPHATGWTWFSPDPTKYGEIRLVLGNNIISMGEPSMHGKFAAVITSPPYSTALKPGSNPLEVHGREGTLLNYTRSPQNLGNLNPFYWEQAMLKVWKGVAQCLRPGGKLAVVNKDIVKGGERELLSAALVRQAKTAGLSYSEWFKWKTPGTIRQETARNKGGTVIEDEDILIFTKA